MPKGKKPIGCKWVYIQLGWLHGVCKARLFAKGDTQGEYYYSMFTFHSYCRKLVPSSARVQHDFLH